MHARRKFFEIARQAEKGKGISAHEALDFIGQLYAIEQEARDSGLDADDVRRLRKEKAYLKAALTRLPTTKQKDIDSLLPHNWKAARA